MSLPGRRALRERAAGLHLLPRRGRGAASAPALEALTVITIRLVPASQARETLAELVELAGAQAPAGPSLVAEVDGEARAALAVAGGELLADPFHPSAELGSLLALRLSQLERRLPERPHAA